MILDYSEVVTQKGSFGINSPTSQNRELYFEKRGVCLYCRVKMDSIHNNNLIDTKTIHGTAWHRSEAVHTCKQCGWWEHSYHSQLEGGGFPEEYKDWEVQVNSAILRRFEIDSNKIPIRTLEQYLEQYPEKIINIHHKKMEELVASIFSEHYHCAANVVGRSNDGGVDVVLITSDKPIVIQVKRRQSLNSCESVAPIRELIGATLLQDSRDCIFVTTATNFTTRAIETKDSALLKNLVDSFELYNRDQFIDVLKLKNVTTEPYFMEYIQMSKLAGTSREDSAEPESVEAVAEEQLLKVK